MAIQIKRSLYLSLAVLSLTAFSTSSAYCQTPEPKLTIANVNFTSPTSDGFYNAYVGLNLQRGGSNPDISFGLQFNHVRTLDEVYDKLKPAVDQLSDELKAASGGFHPPH